MDGLRSSLNSFSISWHMVSLLHIPRTRRFWDPTAGYGSAVREKIHRNILDQSGPTSVMPHRELGA
eukprot:431918-Amphidinium_carterae.1